MTYIISQWAGNSQMLPLHVGDLNPIKYMVTWAQPSHPKMTSQNYQFIRFLTVHECDQPTDTHRERPRYSFCRNRLHLFNATLKQKEIIVANWVLAQTTHVVGSKSNCCIEVVFRCNFVVLKCHQIYLSGFRDVGVEICPYALLK